MGNGTKEFTLNFVSRLHGISVEYLLSLYPTLSRETPIPHGKIIRFNKPKRWLVIAKWFDDWEKWIRSLTFLTRTQQNKLFITSQLHNDLQMTCHAMHDMIHEYVVGNLHRNWVPRRFSQDPLESFFGQIRQSAGGNVDCTRQVVDRNIRKQRFEEKQNRKHNSYFTL